MADFQELKKELNALTGIRKVVMVAKDGTSLLRHNERTGKLGEYIAFVALTADQLKRHLGFNGPSHIVMEQSSGERILALLGEQFILGLDLDARVSPSIILDRLGPVVDRITL